MFQTYRHFWITVRSTGEARWQPGGTFAFTCALDMNYYPFDNQYCTMEVETWHYNSEKLQFNISKHEFGLETYLQHGEWEVYKTLVRYENVEYKYYQDEQFPEVFFSIFIRRKYTFYFMYILLPCIMLSFVLLMTFLLPADSGEKVNLGVSILVAFSVFLLIVAEKVPDTSDAVPIIAIYLMYFMAITALSVMASTIVLKLHFKGSEKKPPKWLQSFVFDCLAPLLCQKSHTHWHTKQQLRNSITMTFVSSPSENECKPMKEVCACSETESERGSADEKAKREKITQEWKKIAEVIDHLFFCTFLFLIILPLGGLVVFAHIFHTTESDIK
ncbi:DgyrCDS8758 [Dimorphilus gyrociliatus]|nr:DgyrCDS8758 [Dimorphilus gyrociliatus]